jgi:hypothetical protein
MRNSQDIDDPRRAWLIQALAAGFFAGGLGQARAQGFSIFGTKPSKLPPSQSIYGISGDVKVNDKAATLATPIKAGDTIQTAKNSEIIFVVNSHSMILRGDSKLVIEPPNPSIGAFIIGGLRLATGKLLSVSRNSPMRLVTATATIGIRGTGFYVESEPEQSYFCTCYGATEVQATDDPQSKEFIAAAHHDRPVYIVKDGGAGKNIRNAPFLNHTDQELSLIETLVGRSTSFVFSKDSYSSPRRNY